VADAYKTLYQGQLPNTVTAIATVPGASSWIVKSIKIANVTAGAVTFILYKNGITDPFITERGTIPAYGSAQYDGTDALAAAEYIAAIAGAASSLNIMISGDQVT
jgi:hypothetical protein